MGIVYFLQPCELIGTDRYKIGRSSKNDLSRVLSYKKGTRYISIIEIDNDKELEKILIDKFNKEYIKIAGNEYFKGNENDMFNSFINEVTDYKNKIIDDLPDTIKIENIKNQWMHKFNYKLNL